MSIFGDLKAALQRHRAYDPARAYLEEATSQVDLEMRQREVDRGRFKQRTVRHF
jgi:hypothetical protein